MPIEQVLSWSADFEGLIIAVFESICGSVDPSGRKAVLISVCSGRCSPGAPVCHGAVSRSDNGFGFSQGDRDQSRQCQISRNLCRTVCIRVFGLSDSRCVSRKPYQQRARCITRRSLHCSKSCWTQGIGGLLPGSLRLSLLCSGVEQHLTSCNCMYQLLLKLEN